MRTPGNDERVARLRRGPTAIRPACRANQQLAMLPRSAGKAHTE